MNFMGFISCTSYCYGCHQLFSYNPARVPSIPIDGDRKPICLDCVNRANPLRIAKGLPPIVPLPGAYEPADESEIEL